MAEISAEGRYHGLDAARAIALLLGITLHAACSFVPGYEKWAIIDSQAGPGPASILFVIHIFRMALFFLMAGFFARLVCYRKGFDYFVRDRARRILLPLVVGWMVLYPLIVWGWIQGMIKRGNSMFPPEVAKLPSWAITIGAFVSGGIFREGFSLAHLWFLYYLLLIYVVVLAARRFVPAREQLDRIFRALIERRWGVLVLAAPVAGVLAAEGSRYGLPNPEALVPVPALVFIYGCFFAAGWMLHRQPDLLGVFERRWLSHAVLGAVLALVLLASQGPGPASRARALVQDAAPYLYALAMWTLVAAFTGLCLRFFAAASPRIRYVSDSSYWLYLLHLPLIVFVQVAISHWQLHWAWKIALIHIVVLPPLFVSYHFLVRATFVGAVLNGRRRGGAEAATCSSTTGVRACEVPAE